jgi:hypothetical protein
MSKSKPPQPTETGTIEDRIRELEEIEEELRLIAGTDCAYAEHAQGFLNALEEVRN